jgi:vacuolar-type H+-ATPase subunit H
MTHQPFDVDVEQIDSAFNRVLAAEAAAREGVERCRGEAERLVAAAEQRARRIANRTDERILAVQRIADMGLERALSDLAAAASAGEGEVMDSEIDGRLGAAIAALADEMIGFGMSSGTAGRGDEPR